MKVTTFTCPNCLASLEMDRAGTMTCPYCGSRVTFEADDGAVHIHTHIHDEAELRRIEIEQERLRREEAERERRAQEKVEGLEQWEDDERVPDPERDAYTKLWRKGVAAVIIALIILFPLSDALPSLNAAVGLFVVCGPIALFVLRPAKYQPGELPQKWRRAVVIYFLGLFLLMCLSDISAFSMMGALWLIVGIVVLVRMRPKKGRHKR